MTVSCKARPEWVDDTHRQLMVRSEAECLALYQRLRMQQASLSPDSLIRLQECLSGPRGLFALLVRELEVLGREAPLLDDISALANRELRTQADKALCFVMGHHRWRNPSPNPFRALSRERLGCLIYDDSAGYTLVERYAALLTLRQLDSQFFGRLIDTTRKSVERRVMFQGLLEHYDALLPIEQCIYPSGYREAQQAHLAQEQVLYGELQLSQPLRTLFDRYAASTLLKKLGVRHARAGRN